MPRESGAQSRDLSLRYRVYGSRIFALPVLSRGQGRACVGDDKRRVSSLMGKGLQRNRPRATLAFTVPRILAAMLGQEGHEFGIVADGVEV